MSYVILTNAEKEFDQIQHPLMIKKKNSWQTRNGREHPQPD